MKGTYTCATGIQTAGKLDHMGAGGRVRGDMMLMTSNPSNLRLQVISPFGATLATLTSDGTTFGFSNMKDRVYLEGPPDACNIARLTQVRLPPHALVQLLRGEAPLLEHSQSPAPSIAWDSAGYYVVRVEGKHETRQEIHLRPTEATFHLPYANQAIEVLFTKVTQRDYVHFEAELQDHAPASTMPPLQDELGLEPPIPPSGPVCSAPVPRRINLRMPYTKDDLMLRFEDLGLNPPLPSGVFRQPVPGGMRRQFVSCTGG